MEQKILNSIRAAVCAIGYADKLISDPSGFDVVRDFNILATGFLIDKNKILTNRHVIEVLKKASPKKNWTLLFFNDSDNTGRFKLSQNIDLGVSFSNDSTESGPFNSSCDLGMLITKESSSDIYNQRKPLKFGDLENLHVGNEVALCGYINGNGFVNFNNLNFSRLGSITYFGKISALAPWEHHKDPRSYTNILTDISNGGGFSGSPLFCSKSGSIIGIHYAGHSEFGLGIAHPLDQSRINDLILRIDCMLRGKTTGFICSPLGDLDDKTRSACLAFLKQNT